MNGKSPTFAQNLSIYENFWLPREPNRQQCVSRFRQFVEGDTTCFERSNLERHITGSALVLDRKRSLVLLTHHAKLDMWIQLGGHCDGDSDVLSVAVREVEEESGLRGLILNYGAGPSVPFDIDILPVPAWNEVPAHDHYDARYLLEADSEIELKITSESLDIRWFTFSEARATSEPTVVRMLEKLQFLEGSEPREPIEAPPR